MPPSFLNLTVSVAILFWIAGAVFSEEVPPVFAEVESSGEPVVEEVGDDEDFILLPDLKVDLNASSSFLSDSNTTQLPNGPSASLFVFGYGANVRSGDEQEQGFYYGFNLQGQLYQYLDSADDFGRDPFESFFSGTTGVNGGFTRIRLDVDYHRNNGNSQQWDRVQRETRRAPSHDYTLDLSVTRKISRGSLELGAGYYLRDFDPGFGLNDGESTYGDVAWMTTPSFAPRSDLGLGLRFGSDSYDGSLSQDYTTPSLRWRYRLSSKTSVHNTFGYEFRTSNAPGAPDSENFVLNGGIDWAATPKTGFGIGYYRRVQPSYVLNGEDLTSTGVTLQMKNRLPKNFVLSTQVGLEGADYFPTGTAAPSGRSDDFLRFALDLSHPLMITERLRGEWAIFFHHNQNKSTLAPVEFEQNVAGIRVGLVY